MTNPRLATPPQTPSARARRVGSGYRSVIIASEAGSIAAAPRPCTARAMINGSGPGATAQPSEATPKTAIPARQTRRWPSTSPSAPAVSIAAASGSV